MNSPRNLRKPRRKEFPSKQHQHQTSTKVSHQIKSVSESSNNYIEERPPELIEKNRDRFVNIYSELPLINLSQSQTQSELEEYDNSSLNISDYLTNDQVIYTDTKAFYPFPVELNNTDVTRFECKVYNRIDIIDTVNTTKSPLLTDQVNCGRDTYNENKFVGVSSNGLSSSMNNTSSIVSSDSSFSYSNSNSISPQETLSRPSAGMSQKPSLLHQPVASKLNRFGFKPGIAQNTVPPTSIPIQQNATNKPIKKTSTTSGQVTPETTLPTTNKVTKLYIEETTLKTPPSPLSNLSKKPNPSQNNGITKRPESPYRSLLKPPTSSGIQAPISNNNINKTTADRKTLSKLHESSSMSSLASSTSSNYSNTKNQATSKTDIRKSSSSESTNKQHQNRVPKTHLVNTTKIALNNNKSPTTRTTYLKPPTTKQINTNKLQSPVKPLQFQSNQIKPPSLATNNNNNQHKRRLFNPYMPNPNIVSTTNSSSNNNNNSSNSNSTKPNVMSGNLKENILKSTLTEQLIKNPDENIENHNDNVNNNSQNEQKQHKFKIYNSSNMKSKLNVVQSLKLSKMPVKGSSLSQPTASKLLQPKTDAMHKKQQPYQNSSNTNSTKLNLENLAKNDASFGMKREDSAYCSSTSSTVSSQEVEICNKISDSKIGNQSNSVNYKTGVQSDSNEQNNNSYDEQKFQSIENDNDIISEKDHIDLNALITSIEPNEVTTDTPQEILIDEKPETSIAESNDEFDDDELSTSINTMNRKLIKRNSIKESIGELNQLMSSASLEETPRSIARQRRTSSTSINSQIGTSLNSGIGSPMFRPPSNLPPAENSELIELDIDTYRLLLQDLQNTKTILYKLANILREPSSNSIPNNNNTNPETFDSQSDENIMTSSFISSLTQLNMNEKNDQATQTDP